MVDREDIRARNITTDYRVRKEFAIEKLLGAYRREHIVAIRAIIGVETVIEVYIPAVWGTYSVPSPKLEKQPNPRVTTTARTLAETYAETYLLGVQFNEPVPARTRGYVSHLRFKKPLEERTVENRV